MKRQSTFTRRVAAHIWFRDKGVCIYCKKDAMLIDHVLPVSFGGRSISANGVLCCRSCNTKKAGYRWEHYVFVAFDHLARHREDLSWVDEVS